MGIASELVLARSVRDVKTAFDAVAQQMTPARLPERPRVAVALPERCGAVQCQAARQERAAQGAIGRIWRERAIDVYASGR